MGLAVHNSQAIREVSVCDSLGAARTLTQKRLVVSKGLGLSAIRIQLKEDERGKDH